MLDACKMFWYQLFYTLCNIFLIIIIWFKCISITFDPWVSWWRHWAALPPHQTAHTPSSAAPQAGCSSSAPRYSYISGPRSPRRTPGRSSPALSSALWPQFGGKLSLSLSPAGGFLASRCLREQKREGIEAQFSTRVTTNYLRIIRNSHRS